MGYKVERECSFGPMALPWLSKAYFGGGDSPDNSAMYAAQAQQDKQDNQLRWAEDQMQKQQAITDRNNQLADAAAAQKKQDDDKAAAIQQFQNDLASATAGARQYAGSKIGQLGLSGGNDYGLQQNFNDLLQSTLSGIGSQQTGNAGALISGQALYDQANSQTLAAERNKLQQQYNQMFGPNYASTTYDDSLLSGDENNLLQQQQVTAQQALDRAHARGQLNDDGYAYAQTQLGQQAAAARSKISAAGQSVLDKYSQQLTDALTGEKTALSNWNYGDPTDLSQFQGTQNAQISKNKAAASGDFLNATAGQSYFDPTTIISGAGTYQGTAGGTGTTTPTAGSGTNASTSTPLATQPVKDTTLTNQGIV